MSNPLSLVKHKSECADAVLKEFNDWVAFCNTEYGESVIAFGGVMVLKDGSLEVYHKQLSPKDRVSLVGALDVLKFKIIKDGFEFEENEE